MVSTVFFLDKAIISDGQGLGKLERYLPDFSDKFGFILQTFSFATYLRKWVLGTAVPILNGDMTRAARRSG
jgi:hypothetical protein